jgi:hypothetical protein
MSRQSTALILRCCFLAAGIPFSSALAECPQSTVSVVGKDPHNAVIFEQTITTDTPSASVSFGQGTKASYNRVDRTIEAVAEVHTNEAFRHVSHAVVVDRFELRGAPIAWVTIRLTTGGRVVTDPAFRMAWVDGSTRVAAHDQEASWHSNYGTAGSIEISVYVLEGEPFEITYELRVEGWGYDPLMAITGRLEFVGLPNGSEMIPCSDALPVESKTWGAVKALYR